MNPPKAPESGLRIVRTPERRLRFAVGHSGSEYARTGECKTFFGRITDTEKSANLFRSRLLTLHFFQPFFRIVSQGRLPLTSLHHLLASIDRQVCEQFRLTQRATTSIF